VTLTYAETAGVKAVTLVYKDVQIFLKRLRRKYKVRYICAGEYGTEKGRTHWHIILFFKGEYPKPENMKQLRFGEKMKPNEYRVDWELWDHGFSYFQEPDINGKSFRYILKYAIKRQDLDSAQMQLTMSKKPPLGHEFFMDLAKEHVEQGVIPRSFLYKIGGVRKRGQDNRFMMQGQTRDDFMTAFKTGFYKKEKLFEGWIEKYGEEPKSEFFEEWDEKNYSVEYTDEELVKRLHYKPVMYVQPWVSYDQDIDLGVLIEAEYFGNEIVIHGKKGENAVYEDGEWRNVDQINEYVTHGKIKRIRSYRDVQREEQERLLRLRNK
jgi:hypothetical protein